MTYLALYGGLIMGLFCLSGVSKASDIPEPSLELSKKFQSTLSNEEKIILAGGCFWCTEAVFQHVKGVMSVVSGYTGGTKDTAIYDSVSDGSTGHAEAVQITYDPKIVNLGKLLHVFFAVAHDPTQKNRQGADVGTQYRSTVFVENKAQRDYVTGYIAELESSKAFTKPIVTTIEDLNEFYVAETYHQDYAARNPDNGYIQSQAMPKVEKVKKMMVNEKDKEATFDFFAEKKVKLTGVQCHVTQEDGTEPAFQNEYWDHKEAGIYVDVVSGEPLFSSLDKFDSGSGWPSFTKPIDKIGVTEKQDTRFGMERIEVRSTKANSHLGHLFNDGPKEKGGMRYCINSAALRFVAKADLEKQGYGQYMSLFH